MCKGVELLQLLFNGGGVSVWAVEHTHDDSICAPPAELNDIIIVHRRARVAPAVVVLSIVPVHEFATGSRGVGG